MKEILNLVRTASEALHLLKSKPSTKSAGLRNSSLRKRKDTSMRLIEAVGDTVDLVDVDVVKDLMKVVKKLRNGEKAADKEFSRLRTALELLEFAVHKKQATSPEHLPWILTELYKGLEYVMRQEALVNAGPAAPYTQTSLPPVVSGSSRSTSPRFRVTA